MKSRKENHKGIALEKFAGVKSTAFDKQKLIAKQRIERIKRAKQHKKVTKKLLSEGKLPQPAIPSYQNQETTDPLKSPDSRGVLDAPRAGASGRKTAHPKEHAQRKQKMPKVSGMEVLVINLKKKREEEAKAEDEARLAAEKHKEQLLAAGRKRKAKKSEYFKKTKRGQPVMKYRIDSILEQLQKTA